MRKIYSVVMLCAMILLCCNSNAYSINLSIVVNKSKQTSLRLVQSSPEKLAYVSTVGEIEVLNHKTDNGNYFRLSIDRFGKSSKVGFPELPVMHQLMEIPLNASVEIEIVNSNVKEYRLSDKGLSTILVPNQFSQSKCGDSKAFEINNDIYSKNNFYAEDLVSVDILGVMRGVNIGRLNISPVSYNPVTNIIKVVEDVEFVITFVDGDMGLTTDLKLKTRSPYFDGIYNQLLNSQYNPKTRENFTIYPMEEKEGIYSY